MRALRSVLALAVLAVLAIPLSAQNLAIAIKTVEPFPYCAISHRGPFSDMPSVVKELVGAMEAQGLLVRIRGPLVGVYYSSPAETKPEDLSWEAGFVVEAQTTTRPPLMLKSWEHRTVAAALYTGPYEGLGRALDGIMAWLGARGYGVDGPVLERYLDQDPSAVPPDKLRTEIWVPVIRPERTK
jgi:effector-binding domain-containing protein